MPNPNRNLLITADTNITYLTDIQLGHGQLLRAEYHAAAVATATESAPITRGLASTLTFPDETFLDTSEEASISDMLSEETLN